MTKTTTLSALASSALALGLLFACGSPKPPEQPHDAEVLPLTHSSATAAPVDTAPPPPASVTASASAPPADSAAPPEKKPRPSGGAPIAVTEDDTAVTTTYGARGGKIRIAGTAELLVPPDAVDTATNFTLALNKGKDQLKITPYKGQLGEVYRIGAGRPDSNAPTFASNGPPFVLKLPLPKGKTTANLAISTGPGKYAVIAPKGVEDGANGQVAVFELPKIWSSAILHLTSAPPTGG